MQRMPFSEHVVGCHEIIVLPIGDSRQAVPCVSIVSKDSDFYRLSVTRGALPKVIWPRVGNSSTHLIDVALRARFGEVLKFDADRLSSLLIVNRPQSGG